MEMPRLFIFPICVTMFRSAARVKTRAPASPKTMNTESLRKRAGVYSPLCILSRKLKNR